MERSPTSTTENKDANDNETSGGKKKNARKLGAFLVEPQEHQPEGVEDKKPDSIWRQFMGRDKAEKPESPESEETAESELEIPEALQADAAETGETEAPLEYMSDAEVQAVLPVIAENHLRLLAEHSGESEAAKDPEAERRVYEFLEAVAEGVGMDMSEAAVLAEHTIESSEGRGPESLQAEDAKPESEQQPLSISEMAAAEIFSRTQEASELPYEDESEPVRAISPPPKPPRPTGRGSNGPNGSNNPFRHSIDIIPFGTGAAAEAAAERIAARDEYLIDLTSASGIVGYLIGRRRGRIKTEKKLLPIKKKLEKQVGELQHQLQLKEQHIRTVVASQNRETQQTKRPERPQQVKQETYQSRVPAAESKQLHSAKPAPERIGQILVEADTVRPIARKNSFEKSPEKAKKISVEVTRVETLDRSELLELSEKIVVEGSTLRQIYETHLVGEKGLRRLVAEHLLGGDVQRALRREIVEHEIDFERDPMLRDRGRQQSSNNGGRAASTPHVTKTLNRLIEHVDSTLTEDAANETAVLQARAAYELREQTRQRKHQRLVDISMISTIALLIAIIILLLLGR